MTSVTEIPNLDLVRTRRDRAGTVRIYTDGTLLGTLSKVAVTGEHGRPVDRWQPRAAVAAWTLYQIGAARPPAELLGPLPPDAHRTTTTAVAALVEYLRANAAAAVNGLYGDQHA